ncbi:hypothetical protein CP8484711_1461, partial [Chlamydia psittaci 84-8471/1]
MFRYKHRQREDESHENCSTILKNASVNRVYGQG